MIKHRIIIALIAAVLLIGLTGAASATSVDIAAINSQERNSAQYFCDGSNDQIEIQAAINAVSSNGGGDVLLRDGTFSILGDITLPNGVNLIGRGAGTTTLKFISEGSVQVNGNNSVRNLQLTGPTGFFITGSHVTFNTVTVRDYSLKRGAFYIYANDQALSDFAFTTCRASDGSSSGFINAGQGSSSSISGVTYTDCSVINAGRMSQFDPWVSGFDLAELTTISNVLVQNCKANGCWESGFYLADGVTANNVIIRDSSSVDNGQKKTRDIPASGAGFFGGSSTMQFINCVSQGNQNGFTLKTGTTIIGCKDTGSKNGFVTTENSEILMADCWSDKAQQWALQALSSHDVTATNFKVTNPSSNPAPAILAGNTEYPSYNMNIQIAGSPVSTAVPTTVSTPVPTAIPTTVSTPIPTAIPTTVSTPIPTAIPTTVSTPIPTAIPTTVSTPIPTAIPTTVSTPIPTAIPTTVSTPIPTAIPTTVSTPIPTAIPTTVSTPIPTAIPTTVATIGPVTNGVEAAAYANAAYTQGNTRLAQMQQAYRAWVVPSRPDLVKIATNVRSSGLKGDGVTDDTAALQSLLTNLPSGSTIYFPPGHYRIDGPISINKPFTLFGESGTVFDCEKATQYVFTLNAKGTSASPMTGMTITGIVFEGPGIETDPAMIDAYYLQNFHVSYVKFHNIGYAAIRVNTCTDVTIEKSIFDNVFQSGLGYGVSITDRSDRIYIHDNFFVTKGRHSVTTGTSQTDLPVADYVQSVTVENNYFENTTEGAIDAHKPTTGPYVIKGNVMNNCVKGVELGSGTAQISDNVIVNCKGGVVLTNVYADPNNLPAKVDQIVDNTMINILYEAIDVDRTNILIQGNVAKGTGNGGTGIYLEPYVPNVCNINGNVIESYARGFQASAPSSTISLVNNFLKSSGSYQTF
ncbi:glycosyl hydrolase family 28-related protein [Methanosphaerula palustris]|uniref:Rhamnogalacturonase A/B/Epimerase-like pectate lyase domain-containing protein n=1 Tax=Methanosphaerula palustris (strain ATCC BAA-1556 / DSM 19958 / E1-9c) TaxID=521011 RepID=B8GG97_METPE|nr:glycosyl hydrolase family 28-related protein [Methanosphaerula palustris]ACL16171.1 hypothetical protein Mpal_0809 [Methanosphaerula palustris E1-9c]